MDQEKITMELNKIYLGHNLDIMQTWPDQCVNLIVTSPPYWGLRDYETEKQIWGGNPKCDHQWNEGKIHKRDGGKDSIKVQIKGRDNFQSRPEIKYKICEKCGAWFGELGQEPDPEMFVSHLCDIFDECKRILADDGSCYVNLGDTYSGSGGFAGQTGIHDNNNKKMPYWKQAKTEIPNKSLIGIPFRFALEMNKRGWILRNTIIWKKPSCMPSSVRDRFTIDFEYIFFFAKSNKTQYYVNEKTLNIQREKPLHTKGIENEDWFYNKHNRKQTYWRSYDYYFKQQFEPLQQSTIERSKYKWCASDSKSSKHQQFNGLNRNEPYKDAINPHGRNKRTVWEINTAQEKEAHFAVFPEELIETPIDANCPTKICSKCGLPQIYTIVRDHPGDTQKGKYSNSDYNGSISSKSSEIKKIIWAKCDCNAKFKPGVVYDPFMGSGTTARVAAKHARDWVGSELNPEYLQIAMKKLKPFLGKKLTEFM